MDWDANSPMIFNSNRDPKTNLRRFVGTFRKVDAIIRIAIASMF